MKTLFLNTLLPITLSTAAVPAVAQPLTPDEAALVTTVESVAALADAGHFESLETLYADEVMMDYTSLFGGTATLYSPEELMTAWAGLLPGFDYTRHTLSDIEVEAGADSAIATADVIAYHQLNDASWQVAGTYDYRFTRTEDAWQITHMTFNLLEEAGDRAILTAATEQAQANPDEYLQRQQTEQIVRDFLGSLETKDMDAFAMVWADDAIQEMPFSPPGFPKLVEGKENILTLYGAWPEISGATNFTAELVFYPMQDPTMVFAEWRGTVEVIPTGRLYEQRYGGLFKVVDGRIQLFREYYDPIVFAEAFGLNAE
ncbi:MAG: nuclear transport factor 2 family protein [Cyanobacteria bacterium J06648_16]